MLRMRMCAFARRITCWSLIPLTAVSVASPALAEDYSFDSTCLEIGGGSSSAQVAEQV